MPLEKHDKMICFKIGSETYKRVKLKVAFDNTTIRAYVTRLIKQDLDSDTRINKHVHKVDLERVLGKEISY